MSDCLFCKIAAGDIPSTCVYENEKVYAFNDINPQAPVHVVVIPRNHIADASCINADNSSDVAVCFEAIADISVKLGLDNGFRVINNCGEDGCQSVKHIHFHILGGKKLPENIV